VTATDRIEILKERAKWNAPNLRARANLLLKLFKPGAFICRKCDAVPSRWQSRVGIGHLDSHEWVLLKTAARECLLDISAESCIAKHAVLACVQGRQLIEVNHVYLDLENREGGFDLTNSAKSFPERVEVLEGIVEPYASLDNPRLDLLDSAQSLLAPLGVIWP
jgi:hypothetical protein